MCEEVSSGSSFWQPKAGLNIGNGTYIFLSSDIPFALILRTVQSIRSFDRPKEINAKQSVEQLQTCSHEQ